MVNRARSGSDDPVPGPTVGRVDDEASAPGDGAIRLTAWVSGRVQGVGFRWWTRARGLELGLSGWAANLDDGRVEVVVEGSAQACDSLVAALRGPRTPGRVAGVVERRTDPRGVPPGFLER